MPMRCTICDHEASKDIDRALAGADPLRVIARRFGVSSSALDRHRRRHLVPQLARSIARHEELSADRLTSWAIGLNEQTLAAVLRCAQEQDYGAMRGLIAESRKNLELIGRLGGFLAATPVHVDARRQVAVLASLTENELRALARGAVAELPQPAEVVDAVAL